MADILLKDRDGTPVAKEGVENGINVLLTDGTEKIYVDSDEVPQPVGRTVELDFSESDSMTITPEEGQVFSSIVIPKPPNLIPENVPEGMNMAGVLGAMVAGGSDFKFAIGTVRGTNGAATVVHNLGVMPDYIQVWINIANSITFACGFSSAFANKYWSNGASGKASTNRYVYNDAGTYRYEASFSDNIDTAAPPYINGANEISFSVGSSETPIGNKSYNFSWLAIGGLA